VAGELAYSSGTRGRGGEWATPVGLAGLSRPARSRRRLEKVVAYPPLSEMGEQQRREFHEVLLDAVPLAVKAEKLTCAGRNLRAGLPTRTISGAS
jgi:hypothetical protein